MDRPIGNTPEVHAECEKWYVMASYRFVKPLLTRQFPGSTGMPGMHSAMCRVQKPNAVISPRSLIPCTPTHRKRRKHAS